MRRGIVIRTVINGLTFDGVRLSPRLLASRVSSASDFDSGGRWAFSRPRHSF
jgi:hypothetical protein